MIIFTFYITTKAILYSFLHHTVIHLYTTVKKPYSYYDNTFPQHPFYQPFTFLARLWHYYQCKKQL